MKLVILTPNLWLHFVGIKSQWAGKKTGAPFGIFNDRPLTWRFNNTVTYLIHQIFMQNMLGEMYRNVPYICALCAKRGGYIQVFTI